MRLGALMTSVFVLGVYYACAFVTFHCGEEPQWTLLDCVYFATVLCSTVGYGDLAPTTPATRALTVVLAIVGIGVVFGIVAGAIETHIIEPLVRPMRRQLARSYPPTVIEVSGLDGRSTAVTVPTKAVYFYAFSLAPMLMLFCALQLLFSALLCAAQPELGFGGALYHMMITSTTVGLGDVPIANDAAKVVVTLRIIVTVGTLATVFSEASRLGAERGRQIERLRLMMRRTDPALLEQLHSSFEAASARAAKEEAERCRQRDPKHRGSGRLRLGLSTFATTTM